MAQARFLPQFEGRKLHTVGEIVIPEETVPAPAPLDPAVQAVQQIKKALSGSQNTA